MIALDTGFSLFPPTVARKTMLIGLLSPLVGIVADTYPQWSRRIAVALVVVMGVVSVWVFLTVFRNASGTNAIMAGAGVAVFVAAMIASMLRLRHDGLRCGAAGLGLGLAVGVAGLLSASIGALVAGLAIAGRMRSDADGSGRVIAHACAGLHRRIARRCADGADCGRERSSLRCFRGTRCRCCCSSPWPYRCRDRRGAC
jgi:hypothetical protein